MSRAAKDIALGWPERLDQRRIVVGRARTVHALRHRPNLCAGDDVCSPARVLSVFCVSLMWLAARLFIVSAQRSPRGWHPPEDAYEGPWARQIPERRERQRNSSTYRFAGGPCVGGRRSTSSDPLASGPGRFGESTSRSTDSRVSLKDFIVPLINPAWPQKHW
jgi:hypothetical protein